MTIQTLLSLIYYDEVSNQLKYYRNNSAVTVSDEGFVSVYNPDTGKVSKFKLHNLAWKIHNKREIPQGCVVLVKNLDTTDIRISNLSLVAKEVQQKVKEAHRGLINLKVVPHGSDQFAYKVIWKDKNVSREKVFYDPAPALALERQLRHKYLKVLTAYCVFD